MPQSNADGGVNWITARYEHDEALRSKGIGPLRSFASAAIAFSPTPELEEMLANGVPYSITIPAEEYILWGSSNLGGYNIPAKPPSGNPE